MRIALMCLLPVPNRCTQVLGITIGICLASWIFAYIAFDLVSLAFPLMPQMDSRHLLATASLGATLMMTRSPASAVGGWVKLLFFVWGKLLKG